MVQWRPPGFDSSVSQPIVSQESAGVGGAWEILIWILVTGCTRLTSVDFWSSPIGRKWNWSDFPYNQLEINWFPPILYQTEFHGFKWTRPVSVPSPANSWEHVLDEEPEESSDWYVLFWPGAKCDEGFFKSIDLSNVSSASDQSMDLDMDRMGNDQRPRLDSTVTVFN